MFEREEIKQELKENYDIDIKHIEKINEGNAEIYEINNEKEKFVLKIFQMKYKSKDIEKECRAFECLNKFGIKTPKYIVCKNGKQFFKKSDGRVCVLQQFIEGRTYKLNQGDEKILLNVAKHLGEIVQALENFKCEDETKIEDWYSEEEFMNAKEKFNQIKSKLNNNEVDKKIKNDLDFKLKVIEKQLNNPDLNDIDKITYKVSHGDYSYLQIIYNGNEHVILDFVRTKRIPIVWEIIRSYSYTDEKCKDGMINMENLIKYTKEVAKYIKLNKYDLKYMPYIYLIQLARSSYGYKEYFEKKENREEILQFAFFRTNICRDLERKAKRISELLLKEVKYI